MCEQLVILLQLANKRHRDITDVLNIFIIHCDIGAIFYGEENRT